MTLRYACMLLLIGLISCKKPAPVPPSGLAGAPHSQASKNEANKLERTILYGTVKEVIQKENFIYLKIETRQQKIEWVAILDGQIKVGDKVSIEEQVVLTDFHSKSLNRTFSKIIFGTIVPKERN